MGFRLLAILVLASALPGADLILHNGKIVTVDARFRVASALAVEGERIVAVGADAEVLKRRTPATRVVDLKGRTVLPGLIDSHVHTLGAALSEYRAKLPPLDSHTAVQAYIREQAQRTPKGQWIVVPRTFPTRLSEMRMPTRAVLDVAAEHPVMFDASYSVVVNSLALRMSGITRETRNPPGGEIVRGPDGEPNGILKNAQGLLKGLNRRDTFTAADKLQAMEEMLRRYAAAGITAVGDRAVNAEEIALFRELRKANRLPVRVVMTWRPPADRALEELARVDYATNQGDEWLKFGAFKITLDGGMTIGTAYQRYPYGAFGKQLYGHTDPDDRGQLFVPLPKLIEILGAARAKGWQLTTHDQGGGAVDTFLDALEAVDKTHPVGATRSHFMHSSFQSPEALKRAQKLGILADVQGQWLYRDGPALEKVFGERGMRYFYPLKSYLDHGIKLAAGSDHMIGYDKNSAVNPYNPFLSLWIMITRRTDRGTVIHAEERIGRADALRAHTIWAAHLQFADNERGSLEPGKFADLVAIDRDYLACPEDEIRKIEPVAVMVAGKLVSGAF